MLRHSLFPPKSPLVVGAFVDGAKSRKCQPGCFVNDGTSRLAQKDLIHENWNMLDPQADNKKSQEIAETTEPVVINELGKESKDQIKGGSDEENVRKAIRFWTHPSLQEIPSEEKLAYLRDRGLSKSEIQTAWERIAEESANDDNGACMGSSHAEIPPNRRSGPPHNRTRSQPLSGSRYNHQTTSHSDYFNDGNNAYPQGDPYHSPSGYHSTAPQPYGSLNPQFEDDASIPMSQGFSLVILGSFLGLTAAAAVRWLNGGDFKLLPPPSHSDSSGRLPSASRRLLLEGPRTLETEGSDEEEVAFLDDAELEEEDISDSLEFKLMEKMESLSESLVSNSALQEKILQKLNLQPTLTDHSMELLRSKNTRDQRRNDDQNDGIDIRAFWCKLVEIKAELAALRRGCPEDCVKINSPLRKHLESTLADIDACLCRAKPWICELQDCHLEEAGTPCTTETSALGSPEAGMESDSHPTQTVALESTTTVGDIVHTTETNPDLRRLSGAHVLLQDSVRRIAEEPDSKVRRAGCQLLYLYVVNLSGQPDNPRYRKIFTSNESFRQVENLNGARDLLYAIGFEEHPNGYLEWNCSDQRGEVDNGKTHEDGIVMKKLHEAAAALRVLKSSGESKNLVESALAVLSQEPLPTTPSMLPPFEAREGFTTEISPAAYASSVAEDPLTSQQSFEVSSNVL